MCHPIDDIRVAFPDGVYSDVRLEQTVDSAISLRNGELRDVQNRTETGALCRVHKEGRWYFASTTDLDRIDAILVELAASTALPAGDAIDLETLLEANQADARRFDDARVDAAPLGEKLRLVRRYAQSLTRPSIRTWAARWADQRRDRRFVSSHGADVRHDYQEAGIILHFTMSDGDQTLSESYFRAGHWFHELVDDAEADIAAMQTFLDRCERFVSSAEPIEPGTATVVMAPKVAGVFAHESFGHKSEADFMLGDPAMLEEWHLGKRIGRPLLSIVDSGEPLGSGYMPYDDEGQKTGRTYLIKDGVLSGRLHAGHTAAALGEGTTANARAMSFRFEPIVRMTTTWIEPGTDTVESLLAGVEDGYFIETIKHGSGMSTFTIAPGMSWRIRDGKIAEPVRIAVLTGTVFETMGEIDGLSDTIERPFLVGGGCGKFDQWPLSVGFGGPHVRVRAMSVA